MQSATRGGTDPSGQLAWALMAQTDWVAVEHHR